MSKKLKKNILIYFKVIKNSNLHHNTKPTLKTIFDRHYNLLGEISMEFNPRLTLFPKSETYSSWMRIPPTEN